MGNLSNCLAPIILVRQRLPCLAIIYAKRNIRTRREKVISIKILLLPDHSFSKTIRIFAEVQWIHL